MLAELLKQKGVSIDKGKVASHHLYLLFGFLRLLKVREKEVGSLEWLNDERRSDDVFAFLSNLSDKLE